MRLQNVREVVFYDKIEEIHHTLRPRYATFVRDQAGSLVLFTPFLVAIFAWWAEADGNWSALIGTSTFFSAIFGLRKFFKSKLYLPASAQEFFRSNNDEMRNIGMRVRQFNVALGAQEKAQRLLPRSEEREKNDEALGIYWEERRKALQDEADYFVLRLRTAVGADLQRMEGVREKYRTNPRRLRRAFKEKVLQLKELEDSLGFMDGGYDTTKDLSPYLAAAKLREQLEQERLELGLPQKALPKLETRPLLLKA